MILMVQSLMYGKAISENNSGIKRNEKETR
jgi:hypothetical protein